MNSYVRDGKVGRKKRQHRSEPVCGRQPPSKRPKRTAVRDKYAPTDSLYRGRRCPLGCFDSAIGPPPPPPPGKNVNKVFSCLNADYVQSKENVYADFCKISNTDVNTDLKEYLKNYDKVHRKKYLEMIFDQCYDISKGCIKQCKSMMKQIEYNKVYVSLEHLTSLSSGIEKKLTKLPKKDGVQKIKRNIHNELVLDKILSTKMLQLFGQDYLELDKQFLIQQSHNDQVHVISKTNTSFEESCPLRIENKCEDSTLTNTQQYLNMKQMEKDTLDNKKIKTHIKTSLIDQNLTAIDDVQDVSHERTAIEIKCSKDTTPSRLNGVALYSVNVRGFEESSSKISIIEEQINVSEGMITNSCSKMISLPEEKNPLIPKMSEEIECSKDTTLSRLNGVDLYSVNIGGFKESSFKASVKEEQINLSGEMISNSCSKMISLPRAEKSSISKTNEEIECFNDTTSLNGIVSYSVNERGLEELSSKTTVIEEQLHVSDEMISKLCSKKEELRKLDTRETDYLNVLNSGLLTSEIVNGSDKLIFKSYTDALALFLKDNLLLMKLKRDICSIIDPNHQFFKNSILNDLALYFTNNDFLYNNHMVWDSTQSELIKEIILELITMLSDTKNNLIYLSSCLVCVFCKIGKNITPNKLNRTFILYIDAIKKYMKHFDLGLWKKLLGNEFYCWCYIVYFIFMNTKNNITMVLENKQVIKNARSFLKKFKHIRYIFIYNSNKTSNTVKSGIFEFTRTDNIESGLLDNTRVDTKDICPASMIPKISISSEFSFKNSFKNKIIVYRKPFNEISEPIPISSDLSRVQSQNVSNLCDSSIKSLDNSSVIQNNPIAINDNSSNISQIEKLVSNIVCSKRTTSNVRVPSPPAYYTVGNSPEKFSISCSSMASNNLIPYYHNISANSNSSNLQTPCSSKKTSTFINVQDNQFRTNENCTQPSTNQPSNDTNMHTNEFNYNMQPSNSVPGLPLANPPSTGVNTQLDQFSKNELNNYVLPPQFGTSGYYKNIQPSICMNMSSTQFGSNTCCTNIQPSTSPYSPNGNIQPYRFATNEFCNDVPVSTKITSQSLSSVNVQPNKFAVKGNLRNIRPPKYNQSLLNRSNLSYVNYGNVTLQPNLNNRDVLNSISDNSIQHTPISLPNIQSTYHNTNTLLVQPTCCNNSQCTGSYEPNVYSTHFSKTPFLYGSNFSTTPPRATPLKDALPRAALLNPVLSGQINNCCPNSYASGQPVATSPAKSFQLPVNKTQISPGLPGEHGEPNLPFQIFVNRNMIGAKIVLDP